MSRSEVNTRLVAIANGDTFTGEWDEARDKNISLSCKTDQDGLLYVDFSPDGTNIDSTVTFSVAAAKNEIHSLLCAKTYFRIRFYNNSGSNQTYFRLETFKNTNSKIITSNLNSILQSDADAIAARTFDTEAQLGLGLLDGIVLINKFGRNPDVDAAEDVWSGGGNYTGFPTTTAEQFMVVSTSANDTSAGTGARTIRLYYLDSNYSMYDANGALYYSDVTLNGATPVASGVTGMRVWRAAVLTSGSGQINAGDISIYWQTTTSNVFAVLKAGFGQTEFGGFTIPKGYIGFVRNVNANMSDSTANGGVLGIKRRAFNSNTFLVAYPFAIATTTEHQHHYYGGLRFEEKEDFIFRIVTINNANGIVNVNFNVILVKQ